MHNTETFIYIFTYYQHSVIVSKAKETEWKNDGINKIPEARNNILSVVSEVINMGISSS